MLTCWRVPETSWRVTCVNQTTSKMKMNSDSPNLEFGFFGELDPSELAYVQGILKNTSCKGIELSWDPTKYVEVGPSSTYTTSAPPCEFLLSCGLEEQRSSITFGTVTEDIQNEHGVGADIQNEHGVGAVASSADQYKVDWSVQSEDSTNPDYLADIEAQMEFEDTPSKTQTKPSYERRNKKRRPPGYYESLEAARNTARPLEQTDIKNSSHEPYAVPTDSSGDIISNVQNKLPNEDSPNTPVNSIGDTQPVMGINKSAEDQSPSNVSVNSAQSPNVPTTMCNSDLRPSATNEPNVPQSMSQTKHSDVKCNSPSVNDVSREGQECKAEILTQSRDFRDPSGETDVSSDISVASAATSQGENVIQSPVENIQEGHFQSKAKSSSWAGLFKTTTPSTVSKPHSDNKLPMHNDKNSEKGRGFAEVGTARCLGGLFTNYAACYRGVSLQPRGLINRGNWCYVNATLQALLACPPFYNLMKPLPADPALDKGPSSTPVIDCVVQFINEFSPMRTQPTEIKPISGPKNAVKIPLIDVHPGVIFEPTYVYNMLQTIKYDAAFKLGHQEDAEEFLSCVLNGLHDEMVAAISRASDKGPTSGETPVSGNSPSSDSSYYDADDEQDQWEQVGPKNKSVITRAATYSKSPVWDIFGGQMRSILHQPGCKESATLQPFFTLQLDVQDKKVWSVEDALELLVVREMVEGYTNAKTRQEVDASRRIMLEQLPPVLVLHLKWFVYDKDGGCQKVYKKVDFDVKLDISKDLMSPNVRSKYQQAQRSYKLFAVLNHHGARAIGGHYTTDTYHSGINGWIRHDDSIIKVVPEKQVLTFSPPKVPYLLYYHRTDLV